MEPTNRLAVEYPIYAMELLSSNKLVIAGGGGAMKSGIPNACEVISFDASTADLSRSASQKLEHAPVALATATDGVVHAIIGTGCKNFIYTDSKLSAASEFEHDLRISSSQEQSAVVVSRNGEMLVVASDEGHVSCISLPHYEPLYRGQLHAQGITDMSITHDGKLVATAARDKKAYIWRARTGEIVESIEPCMPAGLKTHVRAIRFCKAQPDTIFTAESNPRRGGWICARRKDSADGHWRSVASIKSSADALTAFCINEAGDYAAVSSAEGHVAMFRWNGSAFSRVWSTEMRTQFLKPPSPPHVLPVTAMHFCDDDYLVTASADYTVVAWRTQPPSNWTRVLRFSFWLSALLFALVAVLIAEDQQLHGSILQQRQRMQPMLEPHLSNVQSRIRPVVHESRRKLVPYFEDLKQAAEPHVQYVFENVEPYVRRGREYGAAMQPMIESKCAQFRSLLQGRGGSRKNRLQLEKRRKENAK